VRRALTLAIDRLRRITFRIGFPAQKSRDARSSPTYPVKAKCARQTVATRTGTETEMTPLTRRAVLRCSLAFGAAGTLARPYIANAKAKTAEVWWAQGFVQEEDISIKKIVADYEKASGNKIELSIMPFAPQRQKIVSAMQTGVVPDFFPSNPAEMIALYAWDDKLVDVSDVVATQREEFTDTTVVNMNCYNNVLKKRSFYGVPYTTATLPNHIWRPLVEKAGFKIADIPKTWDAYYDFFKEVQKNLRAQGMRNLYGLGLNVTTNGVDPNNVFNYFLTAYGGQGIVAKDGKLHIDDPQVKEAVIKALIYPSTAYKEKYVPPSAINWNDADDNNAFHAKQIVMDLDGTISTEVAVLSQGKKEEYDDIVTMGLALSNDGKPVPSIANNACGLIPKGAKNVEIAKDFLKYFIQPQVNNEWLKTGLGRNIPCMPSVVKDDPWWLKEDPHRVAYVNQGLLGPTMPSFWAYNPAYAQVQNEHTFMTGWMDIIQGGMAPQAAAEKALKRVAEIFAKYPIA
jgi:multiple sugar transport system substrate-binding protein